MSTRHLDAKEVMALLRISPVTLWRMTRDGRLPAPCVYAHKRLWPAEEIEEAARRMARPKSCPSERILPALAGGRSSRTMGLVHRASGATDSE